MLTVKQALLIAAHPVHYHKENLVETLDMLGKQPGTIKLLAELDRRAREELSLAFQSCRQYAPEAISHSR